jgi:hypothetical protein
MSTARALPSVLLSGALLTALAAACSSNNPAIGSGGAGGAATSSSRAVAVAASSGSGLPLTDTFMVTGTVTDGTNPIEGAIVMQGGGQPAMTTGPDGTYTIMLTQAIPGTPTVVAAKVGYRAAGVEFSFLPDGPVDLVLTLPTPPDNPGYAYADPGTGDAAHDNNTSYCGHCHTTFAKQFQSSTHAAAARSPLLQDLYAGVSEAYPSQSVCVAAGGVWRTGLVPGTGSTTSKCYLGGGVLPDLNPSCGGPAQLACDDPAVPAAQKPTAFGRCADCHAPGMNGFAGGRNLHDAAGIAFQDGDHCDFCHHVRDVDLSKPPGVGGALILQRPRDTVDGTPSGHIVQVTYGPMPDVPNGFVGGSYQPKYSASEYCGACHEQKQEALVPGTSVDASRWPAGLPTHSTYSEWAGSSYNAPGMQCQSCHMPPDDTGLTNSLDVTNPSLASITFGFARTPDQIRQHTFLGSLDGKIRLIDAALALALNTASNGTDLTVTVQVKNAGAGHAIPSGEPMRSLVLLVDAQACGQPMAPSGGMTLNDVAGATAQGTVGTGITVAATAMTWPAGAVLAKQGDVVRVVRPMGMYDDYTGIGFFANTALSPAQKGLEIRTPVGEATVLSISAGTLTLSASLLVKNGDVVYLGDALAGQISDGEGSRALAGRVGYTFARVLVDATGARGVPHYRAVDMVSDNRIAPKASSSTSHAFSIPSGCATAGITATLIYRQIPVMQARQRGWKAQDYVVASAIKTVPLP